MKIIFICTKSITFNTFLKSQADFFCKKGFKVEVACLDNTNLNFKSNFTHKIDFPNNLVQLFNLINYLKIFFQIKELVIKNPNAIFYLHTPLSSHLFRLFTFFKNLKIVYFVHGFRFTKITNPIKSLIFKTFEKIFSYKTNIFLTINNEDFNYAKKNLIRKNYCYKVNGVGLDDKNKFQKNRFIKKKGIKKILVISAYKKEKGYDEILQVAELLKNRKLTIDCYGYGNKEKFNLIKNKKDLKNIYFKDFDINLENKIKKYDILLHLSKREGLPVSVMQSLSAGLPVICYDIRGNNDLVKNKFNGFFVKSCSDVIKKINYLNLEDEYFNFMRINALKSIHNNFLKKQINLNLYKIIKNYSKW